MIRALLYVVAMGLFAGLLSYALFWSILVHPDDVKPVESVNAVITSRTEFTTPNESGDLGYVVVEVNDTTERLYFSDIETYKGESTVVMYKSNSGFVLDKPEPYAADGYYRTLWSMTVACAAMGAIIGFGVRLSGRTRQANTSTPRATQSKEVQNA